MKNTFRLAPVAALAAALFGSTGIANAQCDASSFSGSYALHGDGWGLVNFQGEEDMFPVAVIARVESDGAGAITKWDELLVSGAQLGDDGSVIHDGTLTSAHHETFDSITYTVDPDCTLRMTFTIGDFQDGVHGIIVDGGNQVLTLSEADGTGNARDIAAGSMVKLDAADAALTARVEALEAKVDATYALMKQIAARLSIVVE